MQKVTFYNKSTRKNSASQVVTMDKCIQTVSSTEVGVQTESNETMRHVQCEMQTVKYVENEVQTASGDVTTQSDLQDSTVKCSNTSVFVEADKSTRMDSMTVVEEQEFVEQSVDMSREVADNTPICEAPCPPGTARVDTFIPNTCKNERAPDAHVAAEKAPVAQAGIAPLTADTFEVAVVSTPCACPERDSVARDMNKVAQRDLPSFSKSITPQYVDEIQMVPRLFYATSQSTVGERVLLDSCASQNIVSQAFLDYLPRECYKLRPCEKKRFLTASGAIVASKSKAILHFAVLGEVEFFVLGGGDQGRLCLLGGEFFMASEAVISYRSKCLKVGDTHIPFAIQPECPIPAVHVKHDAASGTFNILMDPGDDRNGKPGYAPKSVMDEKQQLAFLIQNHALQAVPGHENNIAEGEGDGQVDRTTARRLQKLHRALGHSPSIIKVLEETGEPPGNIEYMKQLRAVCPSCIRYNNCRKIKPKVGLAQYAQAPCEKWAIDIFYIGQTRFVHLMDLFLRFHVIQHCATGDDVAMVKVLKKALLYMGDSPDELLVDLGTENRNHSLVQWLNDEEVVITPSGFEESGRQGKIETAHQPARRVMLKIFDELGASVDDLQGHDLGDIAEETQERLNSIPILGSTFSPSMLLRGFDRIHKPPKNLENLTEYMQKQQKIREAGFTAIREIDAQNIKRRAETSNLPVQKLADLTVGDFVAIWGGTQKRSARNFDSFGQVVGVTGSSIAHVLRNGAREPTPIHVRHLEIISHDPAKRVEGQLDGKWMCGPNEVEILRGGKLLKMQGEMTPIDHRGENVIWAGFVLSERSENKLVWRNLFGQSLVFERVPPPAPEDSDNAENAASAVANFITEDHGDCNLETLFLCRAVEEEGDTSIDHYVSRCEADKFIDHHVSQCEADHFFINDDEELNSQDEFDAVLHYIETIKQKEPLESDVKVAVAKGFRSINAGRDRARNWFKVHDGTDCHALVSRLLPSDFHVRSIRVFRERRTLPPAPQKGTVRYFVYGPEQPLAEWKNDDPEFSHHCVIIACEGESVGGDVCLRDLFAEADLKKGTIEVTWKWIVANGLQALFEKAIRAEVEALRGYNVFAEDSVSGSSQGKNNVIPSKLVFTLKIDPATGTLKKAKVRWVVKGFRDQRDDLETRTVTTSDIGFMVVLAALSRHNWQAHEADLRNAFVQGEEFKPGEEVWIDVPPAVQSFFGGVGKNCMRLRKPLYGLADAPKRWENELFKKFREVGFTQSEADPAIWYLKSNSRGPGEVVPVCDQIDFPYSVGPIDGIIATHVDDLIFGGTADFHARMKEVFRRFQATTAEIGADGTVFCGKTVVPEGCRFRVSQEAYCEKIKDLSLQAVHDFQKERARRVRTGYGNPVWDKLKSPVRGCVGELLWAIKTRPDLAYDVAECAALALELEDDKTTEKRQKEILGIFNDTVSRARKGKAYGLSIACAADDYFRVIVQTDAGVASGSATAGVLVYIEGTRTKKRTLVEWHAKKIRRACRSSTGAELLAMRSGVSEAQVVRGMLLNLGLSKPEWQISVETDSRNALCVASGGLVFPAEKNLRPDYAVLKQLNLDIRHISGSVNINDALTKKKSDLMPMLQGMLTPKCIRT